MIRARASLLFLGALLVSSAARADDYDAAFTRAIAQKERALDTNDPASWQAALDLFGEADRIRATKESKYELGAAAARLKQDDVAVEAYEAALALGLEGAAGEKAKSFVSEHASGMGRVEVRGPGGAEVWIAARWRGTLPLAKPLVVFAGKRRIELRAGGDRDQREVAVNAGARSMVDFGTSRASEPPPTAPRASAPPPRDRPPILPEPERDDRSLAWTLTVGGASVAALGGVTLLLASSNLTSHRDRLEQYCKTSSGSDSCSEAHPGKQQLAQDEVDSIATWKALRTGGYVGLGAGVVAAGIGVVLLVQDRPSRRALTLSPSVGGAELRGSF